MQKQLAVWLLLLASSFTLASNDYPTLTQFLQQGFGISDIGQAEQNIWWYDTESKAVAEQVLDHPVAALRQRYMSYNGKTAWIIDEIGKERPISIGIVIDHGKITHLDILAFRESRGWEVRLPFFTHQFQQLSLTKNQELSTTIDGITGATLSVRAVKNAARLALYLDARTREQH